MRLEIRYLNEFTYGEPAWESHNLLRACPANDDHQKLAAYRVDVTPTARVHSYTDYWGTRVDEFGIVEPHRELRIMAESTVETRSPSSPSTEATVEALESVRGELSDFLRPSPHAIWDGQIEEAAKEAVTGAIEVVDLATAVSDKVTSTLAYVPGATYVGVDVADVMSKGKGVCQDFAHLGIAMYRSIGVPARYVSGYLYAVEQTSAVAPDEPELSVQTHAWLEVFVPGHGWWGLDPTNAQPVGELHVKIGHGRDYQDVMPLRGVYHGGADHQLGVQVRISRERLSQMAEQ
ncbi:MAG: transglutaminase family protein [Acidimicrobiia bacterium]